MSQHDITVDNDTGSNVRAEMNLIFAAISSLQSGTSAPGATVPFMFWADTTTGLLKMRNAGDTAWVTVARLGASFSYTSNASEWIWEDSVTTPANPGTGKIAGNNANLASCTELYVSKTDQGGQVYPFAAVQAGDIVFLSVVGTPTTYGRYLITAVDTSDTNYVKLTVTNIAGSGNPADDAQVSVTVVPNTPIATSGQALALTVDTAVLTPKKLADSVAVQTLTDASTISYDMSLGLNATVTLAGNRTLDAPTNAKVGTSGFVRIVQDGTGNRTLAYNAAWVFENGTDPVLSTAASTVDLLVWTCISSGVFAASLIKALA